MITDHRGLLEEVFHCVTYCWGKLISLTTTCSKLSQDCSYDLTSTPVSPWITREGEQAALNRFQSWLLPYQQHAENLLHSKKRQVFLLSRVTANYCNLPAAKESSPHTKEHLPVDLEHVTLTKPSCFLITQLSDGHCLGKNCSVKIPASVRIFHTQSFCISSWSHHTALGHWGHFIPLSTVTADEWSCIWKWPQVWQSSGSIWMKL